jgi:hypothetical protein
MSDITALSQAASRPEDGNVGTPEALGQHGDGLGEGDLVTGIIDIADELAYMVHEIRSEDHDREMKEMVRATTWISSPCGSPRKNIRRGGVWTTLPMRLGVWFWVPPPFRKAVLMVPLFTVSPSFHCHHEVYATIIIAPSLKDNKSIRLYLNRDNLRRFDHIAEHGNDPGRCQGTDWLKVSVGLCCCLHGTRCLPAPQRVPPGNTN